MSNQTARKERIKASVIAPGEDVPSSGSSPQQSTTAAPPNNVLSSSAVSSSQQQQQNHHHSSTSFAAHSSPFAASNSSSSSPLEDLLRRRSVDLDEKRSKEWLEYQRLYRQETSSHPKVFIDFIFASEGTNNSHRIVIELFTDVCPRTCENFRDLILGHGGWIEIEKTAAAMPSTASAIPSAGGVGNTNVGSSSMINNNGQAQQQPQQQVTILSKLDFADSRCARILPGVGALFGELPSPLMTPSIPANYNTPSGGGYLTDENFALRHNSRGIVTMVGHGPNTIGSQFMIMFDKNPRFDFKFVPFGRVVEGLPVLERLEKHATTITNQPTHPITISLCGALNGKKPFQMTPPQGVPLIAASSRVMMMMNQQQQQSSSSQNQQQQQQQQQQHRASSGSREKEGSQEPAE